MAELTPNYKLTKPSPEDFYDINVQNDNMDIIDEELKKAAEAAKKMTPEALGVYGYVRQLEANSDLNNLLTTGSYTFTGTDAPTIKNTPVTGTGCHVHVFKASPKDASSESTRQTLQILTTTSTNYNLLYWRKHSSGVWTKWEEFANASDRNIKSYTELSQLGLTSSATIADIFNALPNGGELLLDVATHNTSLYPLTQGTAHFTRRFNYRCFVEFYDYYGATNLTRIKRYYGLYNISTGFSGWHQYYDSYNPQPVETKITNFMTDVNPDVDYESSYIYKIGKIIHGQIELTLSGTKTLDTLDPTLFGISSPDYRPAKGLVIEAMVYALNAAGTSTIIGPENRMAVSIHEGGSVVMFWKQGSGKIKRIALTFSYPCA